MSSRLIFGFMLWSVVLRGAEYDPLAVTHAGEPERVDLMVVDEKRGREVPLRVYLPSASSTAAPVILFSHGLGGSREGNGFLGSHWARRGYVTVFLQHPGSDTAVWENVRPARRARAMREAAKVRNFTLRVEDVSAVLDRLERWALDSGHPLAGRLSLDKVGMSGHSFGAVTTQAVSGQRAAGAFRRATDPRIDAALLMSPSSPRRGSPQEAFGEVSLPWLLMTGTDDTVSIGGADMESRLAVFPALPPGAKYELVLHGAAHSAFTDRDLPGEGARRNPKHHPVILALSTAFWDAFLREQAAARAWLDGEGPRGVLEERDGWRRK